MEYKSNTLCSTTPKFVVETKSAVSVFIFNFFPFWLILTDSTNQNSHAKLSYILLIVYAVLRIAYGAYWISLLIFSIYLYLKPVSPISGHPNELSTKYFTQIYTLSVYDAKKDY